MIHRRHHLFAFIADGLRRLKLRAGGRMFQVYRGPFIDTLLNS